MFWKIYFWVLLLFYLLGAVAAVWFLDDTHVEEVDYLDFCFAMLALVGVFGFTYKKVILNFNVWRVYLPFVILWDISYSVLRDEWVGGEKLVLEIVALGLMLLVLIPQYIAIYLYGFHSRQLWDSQEKPGSEIS